MEIGYQIVSSQKLGKNEKQNEKQYDENYYQLDDAQQTPPEGDWLKS